MIEMPKYHTEFFQKMCLNCCVVTTHAEEIRTTVDDDKGESEEHLMRCGRCGMTYELTFVPPTDQGDIKQ